MDTGMGSDVMDKGVTVERASGREVIVRRTFDAPARLVFAAWTTPELFKQWWVPRSMDVALRSVEMDVRVGGAYKLDFGEGAEFFGTYTDVTPWSRLAWTNDEGGDGGTVTTVTFEEQDGRTHLVLSERYPSEEALEESGTGQLDAMGETFAQLDELLLTQAAPR